MFYPHDRDYLREVTQFAYEVGKLENFLSCIYRVGHEFYNNGKEYVCFLGKDFSAYGFVFACFKMEDCEIVDGYLQRKYGVDPFMNGGIIFHGQHDNGGDGSAPTYSVCLTTTDGWSIHT